MEMKKSEAVKVTLEDFEALPKDERFSYELIDGVVMMSPSPSFDHQKVGSNCTYHLRSKIEAADDRQCDVLYELDIKVNGDVYRPDVLVFCGDDREIPLVVIEVISRPVIVGICCLSRSNMSRLALQSIGSSIQTQG